mmetsp:Transcript_12772/g.34340  ORF Transcript_12772/g.34340 Transcript_12772/m.34340 type:complete len:503 (-) Transcript_12772:2181-3689(-)
MIAADGVGFAFATGGAAAVGQRGAAGALCAGARGGISVRSRARSNKAAAIVLMGGGAVAGRPASLTVQPISRFEGTIDLPGSKSLSNRMLLLAALAEGTTVIEHLLDSDDIRYMLGALQVLQRRVDLDESRQPALSATVHGGAGGAFEVSDKVTLDLGNAGTAMRPLVAAVCASQTGEFVLDGTPRMRERPIKDLVDALQQLGAEVTCSDIGCPPVTVRARANGGGLAGGLARVSGKISSQYLSALLMAAPLASGDVELQIIDELVSLPYVQMTINLMRRFGVEVETDAAHLNFKVRGGQRYAAPAGGRVFVEGDASSASYFSAGAAITGGKVRIEGCGADSVQGDVRFAAVLEQMGASVAWEPDAMTVWREPDVKLRGVDVDCGDIPDAAMTLAVVALFAEGETRIRNVYNWRVKETERMKAIVTELRKLGADVEEGHDFCVIRPPAALIPNVEIETYDDHRMAMCFSLAACAGVPVIILDPACTAKTFPTYFDELARLTV